MSTSPSLLTAPPAAAPAWQERKTLKRPAGLCLAFGLGLASLGGCAAYEPARPGLHRGPGEPQADIRCAYETPTASRFIAMRCQRMEDAKTDEGLARETVDSIKRQMPQLP